MKKNHNSEFHIEDAFKQPINKKLNLRYGEVLLFFAGLFLFILASHTIFQAMIFAEKGRGLLLSDPLHPLFPAPIDLSTLIFAITYSSIFLSVIICSIESIERITFALIVYSCIVFLRSISMITFQLEPPVGMIPLVDPFIAFFNPEQFVATRDLFFSGHCASLLFLFLIARRQWLKRLLMVLTVVLTIAILWQRVHYTVDVIAGFLVAWGVVRVMEFVFYRKPLAFLKVKQLRQQ